MAIANGLIDLYANEVLDSLLGSTSIFPATVYVGLMTAAPNSDGTGVVEPSGNNYARVAVTNDAGHWPAAAGRAKSHAADIVFPAASGGPWGLITWVGIFDAPSGGNLLAADPLANPRTVLDTDVYRFQAGVTPLTITI